MKFKVLLLLLFLFSFAFAQLDLTFYYGTGCPHCAATEKTFEKLGETYDLNIISKEIYSNSENRDEMLSYYEKFNISSLFGGVPTTIINEKVMIIGEMKENNWKTILNECLLDNCEGVYSDQSLDQFSGELTLAIVIGAALVDSINPCTIIIMVMLLGVILLTDGKKKMLFSGLLFIVIIYLLYFIFGLGILKAIDDTNSSVIFYSIITLAALALTIMEINAYFNYKPGFLSVEVPMFLRPYMKQAIKGATSYPGVAIAAFLCSFFLLPCSSGPYLVVLAQLSESIKLDSFSLILEPLGYLILYNFVFVLPMLIILFAIYYGKISAETIGELRNKYIKEIHLISGIILFALFLIMLFRVISFL